MFSKQFGNRIVLFLVVAVMLLSLPLMAAAETMDAQTNGITAPAEGATVKGSVDVSGYASDANFLKWQLDWLIGGDADNAAFLALGETQGAITHTLDTMDMANGDQAIRLRIVHADSNYQEFVTKFVVANPEAAPMAEEAPKPEATPAPKPEEATPAAKPEAEPVEAKPAESEFVAPKADETITGEYVVKGNVMAPEFMKWQLDVLPGNKADEAAFLALGETQGAFTYTLDTMNLPVGENGLRLRVVRPDSNYSEYFVKFMVGEEAAAPAKPEAMPESKPEPKPVETPEPAAPAAEAESDEMMNGITAPKADEKITGTFAVMGYANDPAFAKWQLDLLPGAMEDAASFLAYGAKAGEFSYDLDTTALENGEYALRLRVVRADGNYSEYVTKFAVAHPAE